MRIYMYKKKVISVQKRDLIFILLSKGYVDALPAHDTSVDQFTADTGLKFRILEQPLQSVDLGVAFDRNDARGLQYKTDGRACRYAKRWNNGTDHRKVSVPCRELPGGY